MGTKDKTMDSGDAKAVQKISKDYDATLGGIMASWQLVGKKLEEAAKINQAIMKDAANANADRLKKMEELHDAIFEMMRDITLNKSKVMDKSFNNMDAYIRG